MEIDLPTVVAVAVVCCTLIALAFSFVTASSVLMIRRKVNPIIEEAEVVIQKFRTGLYAEEMANMIVAPVIHLVKPTLDAIESGELLNAMSQHISTAVATGAAEILRSEGARLLGVKGKAVALENAKIAEAKNWITDLAVGGDGTGQMAQMWDSIAEQTGIPVGVIKTVGPIFLQKIQGAVQKTGRSSSSSSHPGALAGGGLW